MAGVHGLEVVFHQQWCIIAALEGGKAMTTNRSLLRFNNDVVRSYREAAREILRRAWSDEKGQDIAEYAVMLAVILVLVVGTIRLVGSNANTVFSQAASSIQ
jgi:Flp pilus assembly pilin Flp